MKNSTEFKKCGQDLIPSSRIVIILLWLPMYADCLQDVHFGDHGDRDGQSENILVTMAYIIVHHCLPMVAKVKTFW